MRSLVALPRRLKTTLAAARELGPASLAQYGLYRLGLASGHYRRVTPPRPLEAYLPAGFTPAPFPPILSIPSSEALAALLGERAAGLRAEAAEILRGKVRLFGGDPFPLELCPPGALPHWTAALSDDLGGDVKLIWEPARLGWAFPLGRAYQLEGDERYPQAFWQLLEEFLACNPPNRGPNWASAQEAALRILAFAFSGQAFAGSQHTTLERTRLLAAAVAAHAARIPPTLPYARAQNNNHLLVEALGLYTAGIILPTHPAAAGWRELGWRWLNKGLQSQIEPGGGYAQHSTNYHRLMLHVALWAQAAARTQNQTLPALTQERLAAATTWLLALFDPAGGCVPNLGHNDGARILPLSQTGFGDYRPVAQAAARAFLGAPALPPGPWDEAGAWLGLPTATVAEQQLAGPWASPAVHRLDSPLSWAALRAVRFTVRPAHADQLHVDLWRRGQAILLDAGSYRYTAPPPWENALACAAVHNTLTVDESEPMERAGKFLWLHWDQARLLCKEPDCIEAEHDGYTRLGVLHRRALTRVTDERWEVLDSLLPLGGAAHSHSAWLHWLLPDWPWQLDQSTLTLHGAVVQLRLEVRLLQADGAGVQAVQLVRAGQALAGPEDVAPVFGWFSPGYNAKQPALSFRVALKGPLPLVVRSKFVFAEPAA